LRGGIPKTCCYSSKIKHFGPPKNFGRHGNGETASRSASCENRHQSICRLSGRAKFFTTGGDIHVLDSAEGCKTLLTPTRCVGATGVGVGKGGQGAPCPTWILKFDIFVLNF